MARYKLLTLLLTQVIVNCLCEINTEEKVKLLNGFVKFYNNLHDQIYKCDEAHLLNAYQTDISNAFNIEAVLKVSHIHNVDETKYIRCTANVANVDMTTSQFEAGMVVMRHKCQDDPLPGENPAHLGATPTVSSTTLLPEITEEIIVREPVHLDNEVQTDHRVTSGEQFIAVPREEPKVYCIGCSSHVNPQAEGVSELADIGIRQLNSLEPGVQHSLNSIVDIERQVQVVNGVRYILTIIVDYNSCSIPDINPCLTSAACKITILEKPWMKLPDNSKYRAILANNCTQEWQFGDDGVVIPKNPNTNTVDNNLNPSSSEGNSDNGIKHVHVAEVHASQQAEKTLTDEDIKNIEDQIIPNIKFDSLPKGNEFLSSTSNPSNKATNNIDRKFESTNQYTSSAANTRKVEDLGDDKKKTIDDLINFFEFAGLDSNINLNEAARLKRSFNTDLHVLDLAEKYLKLKKSIYNSKHIYMLAQYVVDKLNKLDPEPNNRRLLEVTAAEKEYENNNVYYYIQFRIKIMCVKEDCKNEPKMCNSIIEDNHKEPEIISVFCHADDTKNIPQQVKIVPENDPILLRLINEAVKIIENDLTNNSKALRLNKVIEATTQKTSGKLTRISFVVNELDCKKTVPVKLRTKCSVTEKAGTRICDVTILERHWVKEKNITYLCTHRPIDISFSKPEEGFQININDPIVLDMLQEALRYLDEHSNRNNKQVIINIDSIQTKLVAGFLTDIDFIVGYTTCASNVTIQDSSDCRLLENEPLRMCKAKFWDRTWIIDGHKFEVSCDDELHKKVRKYSANANDADLEQSTTSTGDFLEKDPKKHTYKLLAEESLKKYILESGNSQPHRVIKIEKVIVQVVAGTRTVIDFLISPLTMTSENVFSCRSEIWEQKWRHFKQIDVNCHIRSDDKSKVKRSINFPGGSTETDPNKPEYKQLAEESLQKYLQESGNSQPHRVVSVEKVTVQVVAGIKTIIKFNVSPLKSAKRDVINCESEIWEQNWRNFKEIKVKCNIVDHNSRVKRNNNIVGGSTETDPNKPEYKQLAEESLQKYLQESGNSQPHRVVSVEKVTVQVVAGIKTIIQFKVSPLESAKGDVINCESEIWEQEWRNFKEIKVKCNIVDHNSRVKRNNNIVGGSTETDPNKPEYKQLAEESLQKYLHESGNTQPHRVVSVEKVTVQVVAGIKTIIKFKVSPLKSAKGDVINCESEIWEQKWRNFKEIKVQCNIVDHNSRVKRSENIPGGSTETDPNKPEYRQLAEESLQKYLQESGNSQPHRVVSVERVIVQVVAGIKTIIKFKVSPLKSAKGDVINCESEIWEQKWRNFKEIKVKCNIVDHNSRVKRNNNIVGGSTETDPNKPEYKQLAEESLQKYLQESGNSQPHRVVSVERVIVQVVAGIKTIIKFKVSPLKSAKGDVINCESEIWEQKWRNFKEIKVKCNIVDHNSRVKRNNNIVGGSTETDPNKPEYKQLAEESLQKYLQESGNSQPHRVVSVEKVTVQVVAGIKTIIKFKVSPLKSAKGDVINCESEIWEQKWRNFKEIKVQCNIVDHNSRVKRSENIPGGSTETDPNKPEYRQLAEESLQKYLQESGNSQPHRVVSVEKVTVQVVAGIKTIIYFKISPESGDIINCKSVIWERIWRKFQQIDVQCDIDNKITKRNIITGGFMEQNPNSFQYRLMAEKSLEKYLLDTGNSESHKIISVEKVRTQVVAGLRTIIDFIIASKKSSSSMKKCTTDILEVAWQNKTEIRVVCADDELNHARIFKRELKTFYSKDKSRYVGGPRDEDPTDSKYRDYAEDSLHEYKKRHKINNTHVVAKVNKVTTQVISGIRYTIDYVAAPSSCADDLDSCEDVNSVLNCHTVIKKQPWLMRTDIDVACSIPHNKLNKRKASLRQKRQIDDDYIEDDMKFYYADRAVQHLNQETRSNNLYKLITIYDMQNSILMRQTHMVRMYIEVAETFCLRHLDEDHLADCEEMDGMNHKLCLARVWPSPDDDLIVQQVSVICDDNNAFESVTGISLRSLIRASIKEIEKPRQVYYKMVHLGVPQLIPTLDYKMPFKLSFIVGTTNCSKKVENVYKYSCYSDTTKPAKACTSYIWLTPNSRTIDRVSVKCGKTESRQRRSISLDLTNATADDLYIQKLVQDSLDKLEMLSNQRYKQKVLTINSFSTKVTTGKITTIHFDVGFTSCLKYEWVDDSNTCELLEHLPKRKCVSEVWESLWLESGRKINVNCTDEESPLEDYVEFQSAALAQALANRALKHIEAKYPHPRRQKVVRIFSLDKQVVAGIHYRMKIEVGLTNCSALSNQTYCKIDKTGGGENKFCTVNVWLRPWTDNPPNYRVTCDYHGGAMTDMYHHLQAEYLFRDFIATFMPNYMNDQDVMAERFEIFKANIRRIHELNTHERGTATYGVTQFADLTYEEFTSKHMGLKPNLRDENQVPMRKAVIPSGDIPESFDWRTKGAVTEVKNQGSCGSCWAFSVTGNIEGQWKLKTGQLISLSEQELVDCDTMDSGCNGGMPDNAYRAIEQLGGLETEDDYPYEGEDDKCTFNKTMTKVRITGAVNITSNETDMAKWLVANGPISIGINANAMQFYMGGVSHPWRMLCSPGNLDHGVLIVGYGVKDYPLFHKRLPFWIVKNSWGPSWGEQGYYRVYRGDGTCGVNKMASSAVV